MTPSVSVIVPTYNRADMLPEAVESVRAQSFDDWELIIIDDGSQDNTREVVAGMTDGRIHYFHQENRGLPGARNAGIRRARGKYVAFLDSDDRFRSEKLRLQVAFLEAHQEIGLAAGGYAEVDRSLNWIRDIRPWSQQPGLNLEDWLLNCPFCPSVPLIRREWLDRVGLFDESMRRIEDWDLWLRLSGAGCRMAWLEAVVCEYRLHGGNMVRDFLLMKAGMVRMLDKFYEAEPVPAEAIALRSRAYGNIYLNAAGRALAAGDLQEGRNALAESFSCDPGLLEGEPPKALGSLASFALSPLCSDPQAFMGLLGQALCLEKRLPDWSERRLLGLLHAVRAFDGYEREGGWAVTLDALRAATMDLHWAGNRGLMAIAARSILNAKRGERE
jgi:glycosyltransferase involved in cell wall biosynthesis